MIKPDVLRSRVFVVSLAVSLAFGTLEGEASRRPAAANQETSGEVRFAFHYAPSLSEAELQWYSQFDLLVTHDALPRNQVDRLHRAGTKLVLYEWAAAFYETRATAWQQSLRENRKDLLNDSSLTGGSGSDAAAWYFDPHTHAHQFARAADLAERVRGAGYDGVFLDATTFANVHPQAREEYARRHPGIAYDLAFSRLLIELRRKMPAGIVFSNQGYRSAAYYLPYVDWDLTESLVAAPLGVQQWTNPGSPADTIVEAMQGVSAIAARYPDVKYGHLNYQGSDSSPEVVRLVVAVAQLFDSHGYVASEAHSAMDSIYLRNPGRAIAARVNLPDGKGAYRFYENGIIAINAGNEEVVIEHQQTRRLRNHITGELVPGRTITLPSSSGIPRAYFFDIEHSTPALGKV